MVPTRTIRPIIIGLLAIILVLGVTTRSDAEGHDPGIHQRIGVLVHDDRQWKIVSSLRVNTDKGIRLVGAAKCRREGEADLIKLAATSQVEEAYAFIPSHCSWIEIGEAESPRTVQVDGELVLELAQSHQSVVLYHVHAGDQPRVENYFPAYRDLLALALINGDLLENRNRVVHRVVTKFGVIEYQFTDGERVDTLVERLVQTGLGGFVSQNLAFEFMRRKHRDEYLSKVRACAALLGDRHDRIDRCFPLTTAAFSLNIRGVSDPNPACSLGNGYCADQGPDQALVARLAASSGQAGK